MTDVPSGTNQHHRSSSKVMPHFTVYHSYLSGRHHAQRVRTPPPSMKYNFFTIFTIILIA